MAEYHIEKFSEIDVLTVDPVKDKFILPNKKTYIFSDAMCDYCWTAGTVMQNTGEDKEYYCLLCKNNLSWVELKNDFLNPTGDIFKFLLPESWSKAEIEKWYQEYKERRVAQEEVRQHILKHGK